MLESTIEVKFTRTTSEMQRVLLLYGNILLISKSQYTSVYCT